MLVALVAALSAGTLTAAAQVGGVPYALLPTVAQLGSLPGAAPLPGPASVSGRVDALARSAVPGGLPTDALAGQLRSAQIATLLRTQRARVDLDLRGQPVLRSEFLAIAPDAASLDAVRRAGFDVVEAAEGGNELGLDIVVVRDTQRRRASEGMRALQQAAPQVEFAFQHLYLPSGTAISAPARPPTSASGGVPVRVGLVDSGVDPAHPELASLKVHRHGCRGGSVPQVHGTAVAVRLSGGASGQLYAADLWCGDAVGRATLGLVEALGWLSRENVAVVNVSLVGPDNPVLARAIAAMQARGHVIVAAVGNDGPAAPPLYPAAYSGVIGVAAVDSRLRALPESGSGPHVDFAAVGVVDGARGLRGTSFAAPVVARIAAGIARQPAPNAASQVYTALAAQARDLGRPGRDPRYGDGVVELR